MLVRRVDMIECSTEEADAIVMALKMEGIYEDLTKAEALTVVQTRADVGAVVLMFGWVLLEHEQSAWKRLLSIAEKIGGKDFEDGRRL